MLVEFSVKNYRSFKDKVTLSMLAVTNNELENHSAKILNNEILKTAVIYGANASGKSNLINAVLFMSSFVTHSLNKYQSNDDLPYTPFLLDDISRNSPTEFEMLLYIDDYLYKYGFALNCEKVVEEYLFLKKPRVKELLLFSRKDNNIEKTVHFPEGKQIPLKSIRHNALFISVADQFNGEIAGKILKWFHSLTSITEKICNPIQTMSMLENGKITIEWISKLIKVADLDISDLSIEKTNFDSVEEGKNIYSNNVSYAKANQQRISIKTKHIYYQNNAKKETFFDLLSNESDGTNTMFCLAAPLYMSLKNGYPLLIDEIENSLHYDLVKIIHSLFINPETNPKGAQLIFTTHNTSFLSNKFFRRDEVWFTEKDSNSSSKLYSLVEFKNDDKKTRKDASYNKEYLIGKYGAVPIINYDELSNLFRD